MTWPDSCRNSCDLIPSNERVESRFEEIGHVGLSFDQIVYVILVEENYNSVASAVRGFCGGG